MNYNFVGKEERKKQAIAHTKKMDEMHAEKIKDSVNKTKIYIGPFEKRRVEIEVKDSDSVSEIFECADKYAHYNVAVLNFASYKNPGGMFIEGSRAQEECLCHESYLYNVLREFKESYYDVNAKTKNKALYTDRALYTPSVLFERNTDGHIQRGVCDVITCAAPNKAAAQKYMGVPDRENFDVLKKRIRFVLELAEREGVNILIAGAFGCGVFGQSPTEVAQIFKKELESREWHNLCRAVFPIPSGNTNNLAAFKKVFKIDGKEDV